MILAAVNWEAWGAWAGLAGLVVAVASVVIAVVLHRSQQRGQEKTERLHVDQRAALVRLLEIEEARAEKETRLQLEEYRRALIAKEAAQVANLEVKRAMTAINERQAFNIVNRGPADAVILSITARTPGGPSGITEGPYEGEVSLRADTAHQVPVNMIAGPAEVVVRWRDDREEEQEQAFEVNLTRIEIPIHRGGPRG